MRRGQFGRTRRPDPPPPTNPDAQADAVVRQLRGRGAVLSDGTLRLVRNCLRRVAGRIDVPLRGLSPARAAAYIEERGRHVGQATVDSERYALQLMMRLDGRLAEDEPIRLRDDRGHLRTPRERPPANERRAYRPEQIRAVLPALSEGPRLAAEIVAATGVRVHERLTQALLEALGYAVAPVRGHDYVAMPNG